MTPPPTADTNRVMERTDDSDQSSAAANVAPDWLAAADKLHAAGKFAEAIEHYRETVRRDPRPCGRNRSYA